MKNWNKNGIVCRVIEPRRQLAQSLFLWRYERIIDIIPSIFFQSTVFPGYSYFLTRSEGILAYARATFLPFPNCSVCFTRKLISEIPAYRTCDLMISKYTDNLTFPSFYLTINRLTLPCMQLSENSCPFASLKCSYRTGCGSTLQSYVIECNDLIMNKTDQCTERCKNTLVGLTSTVEGKKLMEVIKKSTYSSL